MKPNKFHLSQHQLTAYELASLQGFAPDLNECLMNLGLRQDTFRVLDTEFAINIGVLCTTLTMLGTECKIVSDWRFSQYGILYIADDREKYKLTGTDGVKVTLNHAEFSLAIGVMACRENLIGALIQGFKNPFRISLFYQNVLLHSLKALDKSYVDMEKVLNFIDKHKRKEYLEHEPYFNQYLSLEV